MKNGWFIVEKNIQMDNWGYPLCFRKPPFRSGRYPTFVCTGGYMKTSENQAINICKNGAGSCKVSLLGCASRIVPAGVWTITIIDHWQPILISMNHQQNHVYTATDI